jgi:hypothetical protein
MSVLLRQAPGLTSTLGETISAVYPDAVDLASKETQLPPEGCYKSSGFKSVRFEIRANILGPIPSES